MMKKMKIIKMVFGIFLGSFKFLVLKFLKFYFRCAQISVTKLVSAQNFYYLSEILLYCDVTKQMK